MVQSRALVTVWWKQGTNVRHAQNEILQHVSSDQMFIQP